MRDLFDIKLERLRNENSELNRQLRKLIISDTRRVQIQEELDRTRKLYAKLVELTHFFFSTARRYDLFKAAADFIIYEIGVQRCIIFYLSDNARYLVTYFDGYYSKESCDRIKSFQLERGDGIVKHLLTESAYTILAETESTARLKNMFQIEQIGMAPIYEDGQCTGFIFLGSSETEKETYTTLDQSSEQGNLLKLLAMNLSATLDNLNHLNELVDAKKRIEELAMRDPLTGLYNRRGLQNQIEVELKAFSRALEDRKLRKKCHSIGIILADIDHFKRINDNYGHHVGDIILERISYKLKTGIRRQDSVGRWGGEEFFFFLPETDLSGAINLAEKLRYKIEQLNLKINEKELKVTMSFGVSVFGNEPEGADSIDQAIRSADEKLYDAKNSGRNCVFPQKSGLNRPC